MVPALLPAPAATSPSLIRSSESDKVSGWIAFPFPFLSLEETVEDFFDFDGLSSILEEESESDELSDMGMGWDGMG